LTLTLSQISLRRLNWLTQNTP